MIAKREPLQVNFFYSAYLGCAAFLFSALIATNPASAQSFTAGQQFLKEYCAACHVGKTPAGGFSVVTLNAPGSFRHSPDLWTAAVKRVQNGEMPPKAVPAPNLNRREDFLSYVESGLRAEACPSGPVAGLAPVRRLSRSQYSASVRDLLNLHVDVASAFPADGAGGEGFDNAAETLFLSPILAEKYLDAAKAALTFAAKDPRSRAKFLVAKPGDGITPEEAAKKILDEFLPRAFRRPPSASDTRFYLDLFRSAQKRGDPFEESILYSLRAVLVSPQFLFRSELPNRGTQPRMLNDYDLATRLSYFLWGSGPDGLLLALAEEGKLQDPEVLKGQVARMLRNTKSFDFVQSFIEQWLRTRDLGQSFRPDAGLYPLWSDEELRGDIRYQPVLFFREILSNDLSLLNLIDSKFTIATRKLQKLYGLNVKPPRADNGQQPQRIELPEGTNRGGILGMAAILAVTSHPHRTSPVLRGKWMLEAILGTPPPPPPPDVPTLEEGKAVATHTLRERLAQHRANPVCASCHSRIDPLGFALENYDVMGRWRTEEAGKPIDNSGELPDGSKFAGPDELKAVLMRKKGLVLRNLTNKMLGYALGRGLTLQDSCTVDSIVAEVEKSGYSSHSLIHAVVMSTPFRVQAGTGLSSGKVQKERNKL